MKIFLIIKFNQINMRLTADPHQVLNPYRQLPFLAILFAHYRVDTLAPIYQFHEQHLYILSPPQAVYRQLETSECLEL